MAVGARTRKLPRVLYHYTTGDGLLSMLRSGHIWATDAAYMNDPRELRYGFDRLAELASSHPELRGTALLRDLFVRIEDVRQDKIVHGRIYLASFCESGDLLSQWRAYGALGGGYAMGFQSTHLCGAGEFEQPPARVLQPVLYKMEAQAAVLERWLRRFISENRRARKGADYDSLLWLFSEHLMTLKHPSYQEEREWRLIQFGRFVGTDRGRLAEGEVICSASFRSRAGQIVSYADLDLTRSRGSLAGKLPLVEIVCGPTVRREPGLKALVQLGNSLGFDCVLPDERPHRPRKGRPQLKLRLSEAPFVASGGG